MIVIVDYGVGNVGSILNMLRKVGVRARISSDPAEIAAAAKLILPGVGHFDHGMAKLHASGLIPVLEAQVLERRKPVLGICLGMQMMTRGSEESTVPGLGWIDAFTHRFPDSATLRVPHMGWNVVRPGAGALLFDAPGAAAQAAEPDRFYFVHSYYVKVAAPAALVSTCNYGLDFDASFEFGNIFGVQFHPEKSHLFGMGLLRRFVSS